MLRMMVFYTIADFFTRQNYTEPELLNIFGFSQSAGAVSFGGVTGLLPG